MANISDSRQIMLKDNFEVYERKGVTSSNIMLHYHNFYEIIHILSGSFITSIDGYEYELHAGDFLLINLSKIHKPNFENLITHNNHRIVLWISSSMIENLSTPNFNFKDCFSYGPAFSFPKSETEILSNIILNILNNEKNSDFYANDLLLKAYFLEFFIHFSRFCISKNFKKPENNISNSLFDKVSSYIDKHISENISVSDIANHLFMSKYYFLRKFKLETSITAHEFIIHKRLIKACEFVDKGIPVSKVYELCGFKDYSSFFRNFKNKYKMSPRDYVSLKSISPSNS